MRTCRSLTVCQSLLPRRGVCFWGTVCSQGGVCFWGSVCSQGRCLLQGGESAPTGCLLWGGGCLLPGGVYAPRGGVCSGGCLLWGVSALGGACSVARCLLWGCLLPGVSALGWGVSAPRGVSAPGVSALGGVCSGGVSAPGGVCSGGCLLWGVSALGGVCSVGKCLLCGEVSAPRGVCSGGCLLLGGVCSVGRCLLLGGGLLLGVVSHRALWQTTFLWTESQTPVKTLPWLNFVAAGNNNFSYPTQEYTPLLENPGSATEHWVFCPYIFSNYQYLKCNCTTKKAAKPRTFLKDQ